MKTPSSESSAYTPLPRVLRVFWGASVAAFILMFVIAGATALSGVPREGWNPLADALFGDLLEYIPTFRLVHTADFWGNPLTPSIAYPPFGAILFGGMYATGHPAALYVAIAFAWLGAAVWMVRRRMIAWGIAPATALLFPATLAIVSFPIEGLLQRGNIELWLWIFAAAGVWAFLRRQEDAAAILWGLAAAIKLYPVVFFLLLLPRRRYRAVLIGIATFIAASLLAMLYLGPSLAMAWHGSLHNVFGYQGTRVAEWTLHELAANHSFFGLVKVPVVVAGGSSAGLTLPYYAGGAVVLAAVFFGRLSKMPVANQVLAVSLFMVMLPPVSYFYTLVHLYAPWLMLMSLAIRAKHKGVRVPGLRRTILLFVPVFACYTLFTFRQILLFGGLIQGLLLAALFVCATVFPFAEPAVLQADGA